MAFLTPRFRSTCCSGWLTVEQHFAGTLLCIRQAQSLAHHRAQADTQVKTPAAPLPSGIQPAPIIVARVARSIV
mgnify:CR=1 FL=1